MNSSIETGKPKVGYIGDQAAAVAQELGKHAEVSKLAEGQHPGDLDMVLIDCQSADGRASAQSASPNCFSLGSSLPLPTPRPTFLQGLQTKRSGHRARRVRGARRLLARAGIGPARLSPDDGAGCGAIRHGPGWARPTTMPRQGRCGVRSGAAARAPRRGLSM